MPGRSVQSAASSTRSALPLLRASDQGVRELGPRLGGRNRSRGFYSGHGAGEIVYRKASDARITYYNPAEVELKHDRQGRNASARYCVRRQPVESDGIGTMSKSKKQRRRSAGSHREIRGGHARGYSMMFARPGADDAGMVGQRRRRWMRASEKALGALCGMKKQVQ